MNSKELYLHCVEQNGLSKEEADKLPDSEQQMLEMREGKYWLSKEEQTKFKVVLTGGVFDILHIGHILTLQKAREHGDLLIAVLATDERVQKIKNRAPIHGADYRRAMVAALRQVDLAIIGEENIMKTFERVQPDVVVFGYDQTPMKLPPQCKSVHLTDIKADRTLAKTSEIIRKLGL